MDSSEQLMPRPQQNPQIFSILYEFMLSVSQERFPKITKRENNRRGKKKFNSISKENLKKQRTEEKTWKKQQIYILLLGQCGMGWPNTQTDQDKAKTETFFQNLKEFH